MGRNYILLITACVLILIFISPLICGSSSKECEECHTSPRPSGNYIFSHPIIILTTPTRVSPGQTFNLTVDIEHNGNYELRDISGTLSVSPSTIITINGDNEQYIKSVSSSKTTVSLIWELTAGQVQRNITVNFTIEYTTYFLHLEDPNNYYTYTKTKFQTIDIKPLPLEPSIWNIVVEPGKTKTVTLELAAKKDVAKVKIEPSTEISDWVEIESPDSRWNDGFSNILAGQTREVELTFNIPENVNVNEAYIQISWELEGETDWIEIPVTIKPTLPQEESVNEWLSIIGRITGLLSTVLLAFSLLIGGIGKSQKRFWNRIFKTAKRRADLHCALSYEILALSIFHGIILWAGPYYNTIWSNFIVLGTLSAAAMGVVSINGIFQKQLVKSIGFKSWRYIHLYGSIIALTLCLVHGLTIGTDIGILN
jgi:hypothetical protein